MSSKPLKYKGKYSAISIPIVRGHEIKIKRGYTQKFPSDFADMLLRTQPNNFELVTVSNRESKPE